VVLSDSSVLDSEGYHLLYVAVPLTTAMHLESKVCPRVANPNSRGVTRDSIALLPQIRALDPERLERVSASPLAATDLKKIEDALRLVVGLSGSSTSLP
jgi:mRNA-degrading endonuclease toxin of MazEF toxin-antitoxin module